MTAAEHSGPLSPTDPYGVKGEWVRDDVLALVDRPPARVLSLGCGTCATEVRLQQQGASVTGLDVSADAVVLAQTRIARAFVADVEVDPLEQLAPQSFDLIVCADVLEHLRFTEHVLSRLHGWLADGGALIVSVPNAAHYTVLRELFVRRNWRYEDAGIFDRGHYRLFTKKSLLRMLGENGFTVEAVRPIVSMTGKMRVVHTLLRPLAWVMPFVDEYFAQNWTVRARVRR